MKCRKILLSCILTVALSTSSMLPVLASPEEATSVTESVTEESETQTRDLREEIVEDGPVYVDESTIIDPDQAFDPDLNKGPEKASGIITMYADSGKTGWVHENGNTYYYDENGNMMTGWVLIDGIYYFFANDGVQCFGWITVGGEWYYMDPTDGHMRAGWITTNGNTYFCNASGVMVTGWFKLDDGYHYCSEDKSDGHLIDNTGTRMVADALQYVGGPYVWGGEDLVNGVDCSGYVMKIHEHQGISLVHSSASQYSMCPHKISESELQPGDLIWCRSSANDYSSIYHVMFYVGKLQTNSLQDPGEGNYFDKAIVNAANESKGICIQSYSAYANSTYLSYGTYWR